ncbi:protein phosphatase 2C [Bacillus toyonensis]|uniref:Protein phosphatase 2C n=1 Tax=Bacillus toyonensis TaxID=155322 RepID=A0AB73QV07_9BACI|nr:protein phosphatase 2C [Bacillus toyonensis]PEI84682.1 protein phosphatase 2C [Bacillus toyonensis]PEK53670.1 protein phosphatase 2C [Bacillus toyonensis]PEL50529.1 protein phosphatase 2C [Bacillus toyonensis]PEM85060.1 protein phosphatase 2C [Bacillus toyonensis]PEP80978.1 protein phosphatase 2C [Bacillus toyonensis]
MFKKFKKFMMFAAAAIMLSAGFATAAPHEAHAAHWADNQMHWAFNKGIITADLRDSFATRQDAWLMISRWNGNFVGNYEQARQYMMRKGLSDGTRGTNWVTRNEFIGMLYKMRTGNSPWNPNTGFQAANYWGSEFYIFDGTRGNDAATRAEVISMMYNYNKKYR